MEPSDLSWNLDHVVTQAFFVAARLATLMTFAPFFSNLAVPMRVKGGFTLVLTALLYPQYASRMEVAPANWLPALCGELVCGLIIGLAVSFIFDGIQLAGQIMGFQLGFSLVNVIDPQTQIETPVLATFHQVIGLLIFLQLGVHHWILRALAKSFDYLPVGKAAVTLLSATELVRAAGGMLLIGVQIAAPVLVATILADLALGMLGKASPQLPVLFVGLSVKSMLAYAVLLGAVAFWPRVLESLFQRSIVSAERLMHLIS